MTTTDVRVVFATAPDEQVAERIGRAVVDEGLAACVNILPRIRSIYRWAGALEDTPEVLMVIKTVTRRLDALRERVITLHPYEVPEFLAIEVTNGHPPYLDWIRESTL